MFNLFKKPEPQIIEKYITVSLPVNQKEISKLENKIVFLEGVIDKILKEKEDLETKYNILKVQTKTK
jgi:hypothetical protein